MPGAELFFLLTFASSFDPFFFFFFLFPAAAPSSSSSSISLSLPPVSESSLPSEIPLSPSSLPPPFFPLPLPALSRGGAASDAASTARPSRRRASRRANVSASAAFIRNLKQWRQVDLRSL